MDIGEAYKEAAQSMVYWVDCTADDCAPKLEPADYLCAHA